MVFYLKKTVEELFPEHEKPGEQFSWSFFIRQLMISSQASKWQEGESLLNSMHLKVYVTVSASSPLPFRLLVHSSNNSLSDLRLKHKILNKPPGLSNFSLHHLCSLNHTWPNYFSPRSLTLACGLLCLKWYSFHWLWGWLDCLFQPSS